VTFLNFDDFFVVTVLFAASIFGNFEEVTNCEGSDWFTTRISRAVERSLPPVLLAPGAVISQELQGSGGR
jgi:hypothetical protein